ncbi:MAG TPA: hypothetical protein VEI07_17400 [Planctomycetaceae bacterium]|nr:hypothetical protein [Planctomycetaceae bacterium]
MGAHPYSYLVPYQHDLQRALDELREREFEQGRYNPVMMYPPEFVDERTPRGPGRQHDTINEALEAAEEDGTRSILDIELVGDEAEFGVARRLTEEELEQYFGTTTPNRAQVLDNTPTEDVERGQAVCVPVYDEDGLPLAIYFFGYSCD